METTDTDTHGLGFLVWIDCLLDIETCGNHGDCQLELLSELFLLFVHWKIDTVEARAAGTV